MNSFVNKLFTNQRESLALVYNVTKDRFLKKKVHEGIFSILYVLEYGINKDFKDSITYATEYMKMKSEFANGNEEKTVNEDVNSMIERFKNFNDWLLKCTSITPYPLSKEIYGISSKSYKFQTSMALIIPALYRKIYLQGEKYSSFSFEKIMGSIQYSLINSFLEKADYSVSSTNSKEIFKLVENFKIIDLEVSEN